MPFLSHSGVSQHSGWAQRGSISVAIGNWKLSSLLRSSSRDLDYHLVHILLPKANLDSRNGKYYHFLMWRVASIQVGQVFVGTIFGNTTLMHLWPQQFISFPCVKYSHSSEPLKSHTFMASGQSPGLCQSNKEQLKLFKVVSQVQPLVTKTCVN